MRKRFQISAKELARLRKQFLAAGGSIKELPPQPNNPLRRIPCDSTYENPIADMSASLMGKRGLYHDW